MGVARDTVKRSSCGSSGCVSRRASPPVMREGLVGLRHAMRILALPDGGTAILGGIHQFVSQAERHGFLAAIASGLDHPAHGQRLAARGPNFNRHLVRRTADAARLDLDDGFDVVESGREHLDRLRALPAGLLRDTVERAINDALGGGFLAVLHDDVHELGQHVAVEFRVRQDGADRRLGSTGHLSLLLFGALGAVLGTTLLALAYASAIERPAHRVIADAWQVLNATPADEHYRVLLEIVSFATDVARDFIPIGQPNTADLAQGRVGLLR